MGRPQLDSKIMKAMRCCTGDVPDSGVENNSFGDRTSFPKDKDILSKDTMGNKNLTEDASKGKDKGVDKGFLGKASNDMTGSLHGL